MKIPRRKGIQKTGDDSGNLRFLKNDKKVTSTAFSFFTQYHKNINDFIELF